MKWKKFLLNTANPLTDSQYPTTPNHGYGYGLVDAYEAVSSIVTGLGTLKGQVTKQGDDNEAPVFEHTAPRETYAGMDLELTISVSDNISVASVVSELQRCKWCMANNRSWTQIW